MSPARYRLVIVDDEKIIRSGLTSFIPWSEMGFEVTGCFADGDEAMGFIISNPVHVVLSDIMMVNMTGLDLAAAIQKARPEIRIVLISGYKEFEYAQKALSYNVVDYLLKPINNEEILRVFERIRNDLDRERTNHTIRYANRKLQAFMVGQIVLDSLHGLRRDPEIVLQMLEVAGIDATPDHMLCTHVTISSIPDELGETTAVIAALNENAYDLRFHIVGRKAPEYALIGVSISEYTEEQFSDALERSLREFSVQAKVLFHAEPRYRIEEAAKTLREICDAAHRPFALHPPDDRENVRAVRKDLERWREGIIAGDWDPQADFIDDASTIELATLQNLVVDMVTGVIIRFKEEGIKLLPEMTECIDYDHLYAAADVSSVRDWLGSLIAKILTFVEAGRRLPDHGDVAKAIQFVQRHFRENFSRDDVAEYLSLNPSYFSRIFKEHTGTTFVRYVRSFRVKKAIQLMKERRWPIYQISERVGYSDSKYFAKVFREETGHNPRDHMKLRLDTGDDEC